MRRKLPSSSKQSCLFGRYVHVCMCTQAHVHTPVNADTSPAKASQFICHMPRVVWSRSTIIHSSGLQREWLPSPLIYSPIYTSDTALLHLKTLVDIKKKRNGNLNKSRSAAPSQQWSICFCC